MENFKIPDDFNSVQEIVHKVHYIFDCLNITLQTQDINAMSAMSAEDYFQYSTVYSPEEIFVVMLVAKLSTVDFGTYPNKSFKIIIPAFVDLYDFIVHKKESTVYDMYRSNISLFASSAVNAVSTVSTGELK